jgi:GT2 family glycosyltransferase
VELNTSVIIPTFNRRDAVLQTLAVLAQCEAPAGGWEAILVDDGSTDGTDDAVRDWIKQSNAPVRYEQQPNAGPARARNQGAALAKGDVLIFLDNDILVQPDFLRRHVETLAANPGCWIMGRIHHPAQLRESPFGRYRDDLWEAFHRAHNPDAITETDGITAANISLRAEDFRRLGGFDEGYSIASCEDSELGMRARKSGIRVLYHPGIVVVHNDWAVDLDRFCERQRLYSISDVRLWRVYGDESPRLAMIHANGPINSSDSFSLTAKKLTKSLVATGAGSAILCSTTRLAERIAPDSGLTRRLYDAAIGTAIFRGVREGMKRYPKGS